MASAAVAGERTGWTMEEMLDAFGGEMPEFYFARNDDLNLIYTMFHRFDRKAALYDLVNMNLSRFVNMETGECAFDSEDFKSLLRLAGSGEEVAETGLGLDNFYVQHDLGLSEYDAAVLSSIEQCRVFPWEDKPLLYARTLEGPWDLLIDDALFGGREPLTDYEQRLWDAEIIYNRGTSEYSDIELIVTRYYTYDAADTLDPGWSANGFQKIEILRRGIGKSPLAADYYVGGTDGNVYASFVGFPSASGAGSSFTTCQSMGISASSEAQMDRFWRLYESTEQITGRNDALLDIILEQADVYFAGDKSLEETVQLIKNRASLYVNEHR